MSDFDDIRLPDEIEQGAVGGPGFSTTISVFSSGFERRNQNWARHRAKWNISYGVSEDTFKDVLAFFYGRRGRARGFRFKDWADFTATGEFVATGDGTKTDFQLIKTYDGAFPYVRKITRPISSTVQLYVNGAPAGAADHGLGMYHFTSPPPAGATITWSGEFDVPVRFDTDELPILYQVFKAMGVNAIDLVEILEVP